MYALGREYETYCQAERCTQDFLYLKEKVYLTCLPYCRQRWLNLTPCSLFSNPSLAHSLRAPPSSAHPAARFLDLSTRVFVDCTNLHRNPAFWKDLKCISSFLPSTAVVKTFTVWWSYIYFLFHLLFGKQNLYFLPVVNKCPLRLVFHPSCELTIVSGCVSVIITMACVFFFTSLCWSM